MLVKSFEIVDAFREHPDGLTFAELVRLYPQFPRVSIFRVLSSLESIGYLDKIHGSNRYVLGMKFVELGRIAEHHLGLLEVAVPHMENLLEKFNENVNLGTVRNLELIYLKTLESAHAVRVHEMPNRRTAGYCSGLGKAVLAHMGNEKVEEYLRVVPLKRLTRFTITTASQFRKELELIRQRGYAVDNEENIEGVRCVAVAILNGPGEAFGGLSLSGPAFRMTDDKFRAMAEELRKAAVQIASRCRNAAASTAH